MNFNFEKKKKLLEKTKVSFNNTQEYRNINKKWAKIHCQPLSFSPQVMLVCEI